MSSVLISDWSGFDVGERNSMVDSRGRVQECSKPGILGRLDVLRQQKIPLG